MSIRFWVSAFCLVELAVVNKPSTLQVTEEKVANALWLTKYFKHRSAAQTSTSLLALTTLSLLIPAAFSATAQTKSDAEAGILNLSHGTALILLLVYILFLIFQVRYPKTIEGKGGKYHLTSHVPV